MKFDLNADLAIFIVAATVIIITLMTLVTDNLNRQQALISKNIETAISKGVDPIAVKCAYDTYYDTYKSDLCVTYVMSRKAQ